MPTEKSNWPAIFAAFGIGVIGAVQVGRVAPAGTVLQHDFAMDLTMLGWLVSLITLAAAAMGLAAGVWVTRRGLRWSFIVGSAILCAAVTASVMAQSMPVLLITRLIEGVGYLILIVSAPTLIAREAAPKDTALALALWGTFFTLGLSIAAMTGGALSDWLGWRVWFGINACLTVTALILAFAALPAESPRNGQPARLGSGFSLPTASWLLGAAFLGLTLLTLAILSVLPTFLIQAKGMAPGAAGALTGLVALASIAGSLCYGAMANRIAETRILFFAALILVACAFPAFHEVAPISRIIAFTSVAVFVSGILVAQVFAAVPRMVDDSQKIGPSNGLVAQLGSLGAFAGPPIVGFLVSRQGWGTVPFVIVGFTASFALLFLLALARERKG